MKKVFIPNTDDKSTTDVIEDKLNKVNCANKYFEKGFTFYLKDDYLICQKYDGTEYELCPVDNILELELHTFELHLAFYVVVDTSDVDEIDGNDIGWWCSAQRGFEM